MDHDSSDKPEVPTPSLTRQGSQPDLPPQELAAGDVDPATVTSDEEDEARLPEATEETTEAVAEGRLAVGHAAIEDLLAARTPRSSTRCGSPQPRPASIAC